MVDQIPEKQKSYLIKPPSDSIQSDKSVYKFI